MHPAFPTTRSAASFGLIVALCIGLPVILKWLGPPTRDQAFSAIPVAGGPVGAVQHLIYDDHSAADVVVVGSSLVKTDIQPERLGEILSRRLGHSMRVHVLELNWYGADQQFFMLQDYLAHHPTPPLIILHLPQARAYENGPHPQAYRWLRYGDLRIAKHELPLFSRLQLYGEMVLGSPRQFLALLRPNRITEADGRDDPVPDSTPSEPVQQAALLPANDPMFRVLIPNLYGEYRFGMGPYAMLFLKRIDALVKSAGSHLVLIHLPLNLDPLTDTVQEIQPWDHVFGSDIREIAVPKSQLFANLDSTQFYYPGDNHMNPQGGARFTESIAPAIAEAYSSVTAAAR
jgi:hypothetical protein